MLKNYLIIALRNLLRHKIYSFINIIGLSIGIALFLLIMLFVQNELTHDRYNENYGRILRLQDGNDPNMFASIVELKDIFPEIQNLVRIYNEESHVINYNEKKIVIDKLAFTDASIFQIFTFHFIQGNAKDAFKEPFSIILTESSAKKIFRDKNPIGKIIKYDNQYHLKVTGIIKDIPNNSHIHFNGLISFIDMYKIKGDGVYFMENSDNWSYLTYLLLPITHTQKDISNLENKIYKFYLDKNGWEATDFRLQALKNIYFDKQIQYDQDCKHGNIQFIRIFIAVSIFILLIACVNFISLSTARASLRSKEIGLRKVVGSRKSQLIMQFLSESVLISLLSLCSAILIVQLLLPVFNNLVVSNIEISYLNNPFLWILFIFIIMLIGFISGIYPAFYLTSFKPITILRGGKTKGEESSFFRKSLIVFQFIISIVLIIGTITIYKQLTFMKNKDMGFNKEYIINLPINKDIKNKLNVFKNKCLRFHNIKQFSVSSYALGKIEETWGKEIDGEYKKITCLSVDTSFINIMGLNIIEGRDFLKSDKEKAFLLNETAVQYLDWDDPIGRKLFGHKVIGVLKDFSFQSLHHKITPLMIFYSPKSCELINVKISSDNIEGTITYLNKIWEELSPGFPFEYRFLDETFDKLYKSDERFGTIFVYFSILAIFIASLGLFGLTLFTIEQKTKEIGIRKTFGASVGNIVKMLIKDLTKWILLANIISWPIAYYILGNWLQNFAYRIDFNFGIFITYALSAGLIALLVALSTITFQATKAATANPVESLKYE